MVYIIFILYSTVMVSTIIAILITFINFLEIKRVSTEKTQPLWILPLLLLVTACVPISVILLCICKLYRECIGMILKLKYRETFVGLLNGPDAINTASETVQNVINSVLIYQCPKTMSATEFYESLKAKLRESYVLPKLNVILKQEFGYPYMLREKSNFNNGFRKMESIDAEKYKLSKTELMDLLNKYANSDLPKDNTIPWEILVGSQSIEWRDDNYNYYFTLCRYHHAITDGVSLMKLTLATYADRKNTETSSEDIPNVTMKRCKSFIETLLAVTLIPSWFVSNFALKRRGKHILKQNELRKQCHYVLAFEDHPGYVEKVKRIKSKIPEVSFSAVLLTAISASLNALFTKNSEFTKDINVILPTLPNSTELIDLKQIELIDVKLQNGFSWATLDLPICISNNLVQFDILNRLNLISKKCKALKASSHYQISRLFMNIVAAWFPQQLLVLLLRLTRCSGITSFLPGIPKITCFDGRVQISDYIIWSTNAVDIGFSILINTYDGRLHIGVSIDKTLIENYSDVQEIADNILKYLDILEEEISKSGPDAVEIVL